MVAADLAKEAVSEIATGREVGWNPLVKVYRLEVAAAGVVCEGQIDVGDCGGCDEMPRVTKGLLPHAVLGADLVGRDPVDAFPAEVEEGNFLPAGVQKGMPAVERES